MDPVVHFEIPVDDVERANKFYSGIFGWKIKKIDMPGESSTGGDPYYIVHTAQTDDDNMITKPGAINGGMMKRKDERQPITNYISVESIEESLTKIRDKGGTVFMGKTEIAPGMGWIAVFEDTERNMMGLHEMPKEE